MIYPCTPLIPFASLMISQAYPLKGLITSSAHKQLIVPELPVTRLSLQKYCSTWPGESIFSYIVPESYIETLKIHYIGRLVKACVLIPCRYGKHNLFHYSNLCYKFELADTEFDELSTEICFALGGS